MLKRHVLIIEDDQQTVTILQFILQQAGYVVKVASNGYDGLHHVSNYSFDLILLDINMPMMNGFEFLERFQQMEDVEKCPVIMLTVRNDKSSIVKAKKLGADQYIVKPVEKDSLLKKIEVSIGGCPQFRVVQFDEEDENAQAEMSFSGSITSINEMGMVYTSPVPLEVDQFYTNIEAPLFKSLGVQNPRLQVCECAKREEEPGYEIFFSFVELSEEHIRSIRQWVVEKCLKKAA